MWVLTVAQATLMGAGGAAALTTIGARLSVQAGRRGNHATALWERQSALYDDVLREARRWRRDREDPGQPTPVTRQDQQHTEGRPRAVRDVRHDDVAHRYVEHFDLHWRWAGLMHRWRLSAEINQRALHGEGHPNDLVSDQDMRTMLDLARQARTDADAALDALTTAVRRAIHTVPSLEPAGARRRLRWPGRSTRPAAQLVERNE
ncbi:hypothetical protein [Pseudonocardia sp. HH130630-07]|uniref:hypothetical protein n=1 Tax=Pseudonocardia sp. HH130630-07 TaxID=1690815 RepID=UPI0008151830|nr:hypothetical protein [Pseudonocardia sp. HH130630-07]ANY07791.1 hypothetical protein AFB00_17490 [Pseudonocardia sp. HH130630-07]